MALSELYPQMKAAKPARHWACGLLAALLTLYVFAVPAAEHSTAELLGRADEIKMANHSEFVSILETIASKGEQLNTADQHYLEYLQYWRKAYEGEYELAIKGLSSLIGRIDDDVLKLRAQATMVNVLSIAARYSEAFSLLTTMLESLNEISDYDAREQALGVAALLYNQVEQYSLGIEYAETLIKEDWQGRGVCKGGQLKFEALYRSGRLGNYLEQAEAAIRACSTIADYVRANLTRSYIARYYLDRNRSEDALSLLDAHYAEVVGTRYRILVAEFDSLRARAALNLGQVQEAKKLAENSVAGGVQSQYTEPLVNAYRVLYEVARTEGNSSDALSYHEKYAQADKAYLDDVSARQIAYEKVKHEILAGQVQIEALNQQNQLLQLERENSRLYIALLISVLAFIALWAYKTKRLQVHFMRLSQKDGLTGIANRPHFIDRAERLLDSTRKTGQELCVVLCDLDYFKAINDRYGHAAGDFVLRRTVEVCQSHMRPQDLFGRFGGEEFGIVLAGCELAVARERCEQLRGAIESVTAAEFGMQSNITASFGIASSRTSGHDLRLLLAHADAALYQAKREGRNCVVAYEPKRGTIEPLADASERRAGAA